MKMAWVKFHGFVTEIIGAALGLAAWCLVMKWAFGFDSWTQLFFIGR